MKRDILKIKRKVSGCCPGHDDFPDQKYKSRRSQKARSRHKKVEHQYVRSILKRQIIEDIKENT